MNRKPSIVFVSLTLCFLFTYSSFLTSPPQMEIENGTFVVIGDTQHIGFWESLYWEYWGEHNEEKTRLLFKKIADENPGFILHLGDITSDGSDESKWRDFDYDNRPVNEKKIPYYAAFGNHEYFGDSTAMYNHFYSRFPLVQKKKWYSIIKGGIGFVVFNSNFSDLSPSDVVRQRAWFKEQLKEMEENPYVKNIIVAGHHPPFTNSKIVNPDYEVKKDFADPFSATKKGMFFFSGHCHSYERFFYNKKQFIVSGGGGGPRQKLNVEKGSRKYNDLFDGPAKRFFHFCHIEYTNDSLFFRAVMLNDDNSFGIAEKLSFKR